MSKKIRVVFYKAKTGDGHWLDNAINTWTWLISAKNRSVGPYSHVEIWTDESDVGFESTFLVPYTPCSHRGCLSHISHPCEGCGRTGGSPYVGTCWTSTMRGENNGTVSRPANTVIENAERWDYAEIELITPQYERLAKWMNKEVKANKGYSMRDILKFFGLGVLSDSKRNICSEFCSNAINKAFGFGEEDEVVSPRRLAWKLKQAGYQIKPLKEGV